MLGLYIMLLAFYLGTGLLARKKPTNLERHVGMVGFVCLTPGIISGRLPLLILPILVLMTAGYLHRAR
jgi:hypothetical protein